MSATLNLSIAVVTAAIAAAAATVTPRLRAQRAAVARAEAIGLRALPVTRQDDRVSFSLRLRPKSVCPFSVADMIRLELQYSKTPRVLVTIEALMPGDKSVAVFSRMVSERDLFKGSTIPVTLSIKNRDANLALLICRDGAGTGRCTDKPVTRSTAWGGMYFNPLRPLPKEYRAKDRLYHFDYLLLEQDKLWTPTVKDLHSLSLRELKDHVSGQFGSAKVGHRVAQLITRLNGRLESEPAFPGEDALNVFVPQATPSLCKRQMAEESDDDVWR